jgi:hypothetical protein
MNAATIEFASPVSTSLITNKRCRDIFEEPEELADDSFEVVEEEEEEEEEVEEEISDDEKSVDSSYAYKSIYFTLPENHPTGTPNVEEVGQWKEIYKMSREDWPFAAYTTDDVVSYL